MEFFTRNLPAYKIAASSKQAARAPATGSWFSNLFGSLFGSAPTYKTVDGRRITVPASSGFWSLFGAFGAASPSYKTAPTASGAAIDAEALAAEALLGGCECVAGAGGVDVDLDEAACAPAEDQIVIL